MRFEEISKKEMWPGTDIARAEADLSANVDELEKGLDGLDFARNAKKEIAEIVSRKREVPGRFEAIQGRLDALLLTIPGAAFGGPVLGSLIDSSIGRGEIISGAIVGGAVGAFLVVAKGFAKLREIEALVALSQKDSQNYAK